MQVTKCLIIAVLVLLAPTAWADQEKLSGTRDASCIVKITVDPSIMPLNGQTLDYLQHLLGSSMARRAARDVLGLEGDAVGPALQDTHFEWLAESTQRPAQTAMPGASRERSSRRGRGSSNRTDDQGYNAMMKELAEIYGDRYTLGTRAVDANSPKDANRAESRGRGMMMDSMGGAMGGMSRGMGGGMMGGGMGGMMGGGGMSGGVMGSMGGRSAPTQPVTHTVMLKLSVKLPEQVKPAAREFLGAIVQNLKKTLWAAYERQAAELKEAADFAESQRKEAAAALDLAMGVRSPERIQVEEQLDTFVDLSILTPEMPVAEAFDHIKNAVSPPLPLVVMWKELLDNCEIEPTTPIDMEGLPEARLRVNLKALVEAIGGGSFKVSYQVEDGVVIVRDAERQTVQTPPAVPTTRIDIQDLAARRRELSRQFERLAIDTVTKAARRRAIQELIARIQEETQEKLANDTVTQELEKLVKVSSDHLEFLLGAYEAGTQGAPELNAARENLARAKIELARRREELSKITGGERLAELNKDLSTITIDTAETDAQMKIVNGLLEETQQQWTQASRFDPKAARIQVAKEALDIADRNVLALKKRLANLQPPTVTTIGSN